MKAFMIGLVTAVVVLGACAAYVAFSGAYDVAATEPHLRTTRYLLETTVYNSVKARAGDAPAPPDDLDSPSTIAAGAGRYEAMCEHCHGGPGIEAAEWSRGMRPEPPGLPDVAPAWSARELYWIVEHGIKLSGMPAFGPTHDEAALWEVVGFVSALPDMSAQEYRELRESSQRGG